MGTRAHNLVRIAEEVALGVHDIRDGDILGTNQAHEGHHVGDLSARVGHVHGRVSTGGSVATVGCLQTLSDTGVVLEAGVTVLLLPESPQAVDLSVVHEENGIYFIAIKLVMIRDSLRGDEV